MTKHIFKRLGFSWALFFCLASVAQEAGPYLEAFGLEYRQEVQTEPRPNRIHILRIDLTRHKAWPVVVVADDPDGAGPAEAALTNPLQLAGDRAVLAFVNANPWDSLPDANGTRNRRWFEGQPVVIRGLAVSNSDVASQPESGSASVWVNADGRVSLSEPPAGAAIHQGMCGFQQIVRAGVIVVDPGGPRHPRTAMGVDTAGSVLWLVVVDGRQPGFSEGMTLHELAVVMKSAGCVQATNMDGGGSSILGLRTSTGRLRIVNSPSDRDAGAQPKIRPLPVILTICQRPEPSVPE